MSPFQFEGDYKGLSSRQLDFICQVIKDRGFTKGSVLIEIVGNVDDNYGANVKRISIQEGGQTFKMVAKIAPSNKEVRNTMPFETAFINEHIMYTQVLPTFSNLEKEVDVPESERLRYAQCYGTLMEQLDEIILLEDLKETHFSILNKYISLSNDSVKLVLKDLAKLHSLSYALKNRYPDVYETFKGLLINSSAVMQSKPEMKSFFSQLENSAIATVKSDKYKNALKGSLTKIPDHLVKNMKRYDFNSKYSVIQQGDPWTNNIMFRAESDKIVECCMIDYQLSCHNSPVADLHYMIFNCTDYATRSKHYHDWIDYYHSQLDKLLSNFGLKVNFIFPKDQLDADLRRLGKLHFANSILLASMLTRDTQDAAKVKDAMQENGLENMAEAISDFGSMAKTSMTRFKEKIEGLTDSFLEFGYI